MRCRTSPGGLALVTALILSAALSSVHAQQSAGSPFRSFQKNNRTVRGILIGIEKAGETVWIWTDSGRIFPAKIASFAEVDQEYIREWRSGEAVLVAECANLPMAGILAARGYEAVPFRIAGNHILADGTVNGVKTRFLIDTGAGSTVFDIAFAEKAACKIGPMDQIMSGIGGNSKAALVEVEEILLGNATMKNQVRLAGDLFHGKPGPFSSRSHDVILGADFLREHHAVISYPENRIFFLSGNPRQVQQKLAKSFTDYRKFETLDGYKAKGRMRRRTDSHALIELENGKKTTVAVATLDFADQEYVKEWDQSLYLFLSRCRKLPLERVLELRGYEGIPYQFKGNHIFTTAELNGTKRRFMIDTGAGTTVLNLRDARDAGCDVGRLEHTISGLSGEALAAAAMVRSLRIGKAELTNRRLFATGLQAQWDALGEFGGILGADCFRELDGIVHYQNDRIFLRQD